MLSILLLLKLVPMNVDLYLLSLYNLSLHKISMFHYYSLLALGCCCCHSLLCCSYKTFPLSLCRSFGCLLLCPMPPLSLELYLKMLTPSILFLVLSCCSLGLFYLLLNFLLYLCLCIHHLNPPPPPLFLCYYVTCLMFPLGLSLHTP